MQKETALYIGTECSEPNHLDDHLKSIGIELHTVSSMPIAKQRLGEHKYDLLLIQFESIRKQIFEFCSYVRCEYYKAVILVLMSKAMPRIESKLFECGIDDIAAGKQTLPAALKSRIRRRLVNRSPMPKNQTIKLKGGAIIDLERGEIRLNGSHHRIRGVCSELLRYFLEHPHRAISREELLKSQIWDNSVSSPDKVEQGKAIDMAVTRLRRLIEPDPSYPQIITTVHGIGWILAKDTVL